MKRHVQEFGVKPWAGQDLLDLQAEPFKVLDSFFQEYGHCIIKGCEVTPAGNLFNVAPGLVALAGTDSDGAATFKAVPFAGAEAVTLPLYLTLTHTVVTRPYADKKVRPIAYDYRATASTVQPTDTPFLEITATGGSRFVDAIKVTGKLDKTGNGRDVTVTFTEAAERVNITSGEKLSGLFGKIAKWLASLKTVAFTGKAADLEQDANNRLVSDTEKAAWADKYTRTETYTRTEVEQKIASVVDSAPGTLDTLKELAAALGNDPNFATSIMALIGGKADTAHAHTIANVTNLQNELNGKFDKTGGTIQSPNYIASSFFHPGPGTSILIGSEKEFKKSVQVGYVQNAASIDDSYFHITPYELAEGSVFKINTKGEAMLQGDKTVWHAGNLNPADFQPKQPFAMSARHSAGYFGIYIPTAKPGDYIEFWSSVADWYGLKCGNLDVFGTAKVNDKPIATTDQIADKADKNHAHAGTMKIIIAGHVSAGGQRMDDSAGLIFQADLTGDTYTVIHSRGNLNYHVTLTGGKGNGRGGHVYASLIEKGTTYFKVKTADDDSPNPGDFYFTMYEIV